MTRLEANKKIIEAVSKAVEMFPDWRFHQILQNIGCVVLDVDQWHEEPEDTLERISSNVIVKMLKES